MNIGQENSASARHGSAYCIYSHPEVPLSGPTGHLALFGEVHYVLLRMLWRSPSPRFRRNPPTGFILPCNPTLVDRPPAGPGWLHEVKFDGYRILARKQGERVTALDPAVARTTRKSCRGSRSGSPTVC
jgi:hypothetical protein